MKKCFSLLVVLLLFILNSNISFAQDTLYNTTVIPDSIQSSYQDQHHYLKAPALIVPGTLLLYGGLKPVINGIPKLDNSIMENLQENNTSFQPKLADYIMWAPSASIYVMDAMRVKTVHNFRQHLILDAGSIIITGGIGYGMRLISKNIEAYNTSNTKFPSGHTANAFRGAEILHQELKYTHKWWSYSGYVVATGVGLLRIYNREHYLTEVIAGAGLGILSTKLTYWIFEKASRNSKR